MLNGSNPASNHIKRDLRFREIKLDARLDAEASTRVVSKNLANNYMLCYTEWAGKRRVGTGNGDD